MWHSVHVHYHGRDIDALILDAVRPLFARLQPRVASAYFVRHWLRGPHLRLNLQTTPEAFTTVVRPAVEEVVGGYLAIRPSRAAPDPVELLPMHQRLAALEHENGPLLPWHPDNSIVVAPYDRRLAVLGSEDAAELLAEFLTDTTELSFQMTDHVQRPGRRLQVAFDLMVAVAHALSGAGIRRGFVSYRSHAEAFLHAWPEGAGQRDAWDRHYRRHEPALTRRLESVVTAIDEAAPAIPFVLPWIDTLWRYQRRGLALIEAGRLTMTPPEPREAARIPRVSIVSPLHRAVAASEAYHRYVRSSPAFAAYRLALNYTYVQLTRLGVTPIERFLLCHLVANTVEQRYGRSAMDLLRELDGHEPDPAGSRS